MSRLRVGLVGCGFWGSNHARVYGELEDLCELVAVCDVDETRAYKLARKYRCKPYRSYREMFETEKLDAVSICTPSTTHFTVAYEAAERGLNILVEKPMCTTVEQASKLVEKAESEGVLLMPGHIECFNPGVRRVKSLIADGRLGDILMVSARRVSFWPERIGDVGIVMDTAIHDIYVFKFILGRSPAEVYAVTGKLAHRFEDYVEALLKFDVGTVGFIEANWMTPRKIRSLIVTGSLAVASLDYITQEIVYEDRDRRISPISRWEEPLKKEIKHFVESCLGKSRLQITGYDGLEALRVCEAILESGREGKPVEVK